MFECVSCRRRARTARSAKRERRSRRGTFVERGGGRGALFSPLVPRSVLNPFVRSFSLAGGPLSSSVSVAPRRRRHSRGVGSGRIVVVRGAPSFVRRLRDAILRLDDRQIDLKPI